MTTEIKGDATSIFEAIAGHISGSDIWPLLIIGFMMWFIYDQRNNRKSLREINDAVNNSKDDQNEATRGVPLRKLVVDNQVSMLKLEGKVTVLGEKVDAVKQEIDAHRNDDAKVITRLANKLAPKDVGNGDKRRSGKAQAQRSRRGE